MTKTLLNQNRLPKRLGIVLLVLTLLVSAWQIPAFYSKPISNQEAEDYLAIIQQSELPSEAREELLTSLVPFMAADDGQPIYMLNLMRFYRELRTIASNESFNTPQEANAYYESKTLALLARNGGQPLYMGTINSPNVLVQDDELNHWDRLLLIRYPSRRDFLNLLTDPDYALLAPYKMMSLKVLLTASEAQLIMPPLWVCTALASLFIFLSVALVRARRSGEAS